MTWLRKKMVLIKIVKRLAPLCRYNPWLIYDWLFKPRYDMYDLSYHDMYRLDEGEFVLDLLNLEKWGKATKEGYDYGELWKK